MSDYQMPLFNTYSITVELDRRRHYIRSAMRARRDELTQMSKRELEYEFIDCAEICGLELHVDARSMRMTDAQDKAIGASHKFEMEVPYRGDDELWLLNPGVEGPFPDGEWFRNKLILTSLAKSYSQARALFDERLEEILVIIAQQQEHLDLFDEALSSYIHSFAQVLAQESSVIDFRRRG